MYTLNESSGRQLWTRINFKSFKIITMVKKHKTYRNVTVSNGWQKSFIFLKSLVHLEIVYNR